MSRWEKEKQSRQSMLNALMSSGMFDASTIFPEHFGPSAEKIAATAQQAADDFMDPEAMIDFSEVVWTPTTEEAYLEMVRLMEEAEAEDDEAHPEAGEPQQDGEWV